MFGDILNRLHEAMFNNMQCAYYKY